MCVFLNCTYGFAENDTSSSFNDQYIHHIQYKMHLGCRADDDTSNSPACVVINYQVIRHYCCTFSNHIKITDPRDCGHYISYIYETIYWLCISKLCCFYELLPPRSDIWADTNGTVVYVGVMKTASGFLIFSYFLIG